MRHSEALLQFLLCESHLFRVLCLSVELNHTLILAQHSVEDPHFAAFLHVLAVESLLWSLALLNHPHLYCVDLFGSTVDPLLALALLGLGNSKGSFGLLEAGSVGFS